MLVILSNTYQLCVACVEDKEQMSHHTAESEGSVDESDGPERVPEGVLQGIEDIIEGRTASKEDLLEASRSG